MKITLPLLASVIIVLAGLSTGCSRQPDPSSAEFQLACHGERLGTMARRQRAMEDGYDIDKKHDCISRASYTAIQNSASAAQDPQLIEWKAQREREREEEMAREQQRQTLERLAEENRIARERAEYDERRRAEREMRN